MKKNDIRRRQKSSRPPVLQRVRAFGMAGASRLPRGGASVFRPFAPIDRTRYLCLSYAIFDEMLMVSGRPVRLVRLGSARWHWNTGKAVHGYNGHMGSRTYRIAVSVIAGSSASNG